MGRSVRYETLHRLGRVDLRRYGPLVIARTEGAGNGGRNTLKRYLGGANRDRSSGGGVQVPTASPVLTAGGAMAVVMAPEYTMDTTPEPVDPEVLVVEIPPRVLAVLPFRGRWSERAFERRSRELLAALAGAGLGTRGDVFTMHYGPDLAPPFLRRNEVAVEVVVE